MIRRKSISRTGAMALGAALALVASSGTTERTTTLPAAHTTLASASVTPAAVQDWFDYDRPAEYEVVVSDLAVPTRDGTDLGCKLMQPGHNGVVDSGRHPGIVSNLWPYGIYVLPYFQYFAQRGYNVITCDVRGSGTSEGTFPSWFQRVEARDNYDLIEWFAAQPYSTGAVAQMGESYGSITSYRAAALRPPSLRTIVPIVSPTNIYSEWIYPGGVPSTNGADWQADPVVSPAEHASTLQSFQDNPTYNSFWRQATTTDKLKDVRIPALHIGGYFDIFKEGGFDALSQRPRQTWLLNGPWTHSGFMSAPGQDRPGVVDLSYGVILEWFDHWLLELPDADLPPNRVTSFESTSDANGGAWTAGETWPLPGTQSRRLYPTVDGGLAPTKPASGQTQYSVSPLDGPSVASLGTMPHVPSQNQAANERAGASTPTGKCSRCARTTFTMPAFEQATSVAGPVTLHLMASITANDTYFVSKLESVLPDGRVLPVETGYLRAQLRESLSRPTKVQPGRPTRYEIDLGNTHWQFQPGERLRITLSGGDFPKIMPTAPAGLVTIHHGRDTYVDLPVASN